jgi:hypothetical protein
VQDLAAHDCICFEPIANGNLWRFRVDARDVAVPVRPRLTVTTAEAAIDAAVSGLGVTTVLSYQAESAVRSGQLALLLEPFEPPPLPVSMVYASRGRLPLKLRALLDFAAPRLRQRLLDVAAALTPAALGKVARHPPLGGPESSAKPPRTRQRASVHATREQPPRKSFPTSASRPTGRSRLQEAAARHSGDPAPE